MNWQTSEPPHCPTCHCGIQCPACESKAQRIAELEAEKRGSVCAADPHGVHGTCEYWKAAMEEGRRQEARITELEAECDRLRVALEACRHEAEKMRIWNGQGWTYHPPCAGRVRKFADDALKAREECR